METSPTLDPLSATTLQTPGTDLTPGFVAMPVGEIFGVHAHIQDVCRRLAPDAGLVPGPWGLTQSLAV